MRYELCTLQQQRDVVYSGQALSLDGRPLFFADASRRSFPPNFDDHAHPDLQAAPKLQLFQSMEEQIRYLQAMCEGTIVSGSTKQSTCTHLAS